jgi:hypothetical protein
MPTRVVNFIALPAPVTTGRNNNDEFNSAVMPALLFQ